MQLGISSYAFTWAVGVSDLMPDQPLTAFDLVDKAARLEVPIVQIADNLPLHELSSEQLDHLKVHARQKGIQIEVGSRGLTSDNLYIYLDIAKRLCSPLLRMVIDKDGLEPPLEECIATIKQVAPDLAQSKIHLVIENHDRFKAEDFASMVAESDSPWVGICLDSVNSMGAGEGIKEVIKTLAPFTLNVHLKDFYIKRVWHKMGFVIEGLPAGQGMLDIPWLLKEIDKYNQCHSAILELWTPPETELKQTIVKEESWVQDSIRFLKPYFINPKS